MQLKLAVIPIFILSLLALTHPKPALAAPSDNVICEQNGINTAIGCVPVLNNDSGTSFSGFVLKWAIGVGGGVAFFLIVYAGFMIMTSQGNPERLKAGQELLTSAISGVILLVLCVFILNVIGVNILKIPGFSK